MRDREQPGRIRSNVPLILSLAGAAGFVVLSLSPRPSGWPSWVLKAVAVLLATFGPISTQLEKRRAEEANRLRVQVEVNSGTIAAFLATEAYIDAWLALEQQVCLKSLDDWEAQQARRGEKSTSTFDATVGNGPTVREVMELEEREKAGDVLSAKETRVLRHNREIMAEALKPLVQTLNFMGRSEQRSTMDYRAEVRDYLEAARDSARRRATEEFVASGLGRICLQVTNPTDLPFESVVVELTFPEGIELFGWKERPRHRAVLPQRPVAFGTWVPHNFGSYPFAAIGALTPRPFGFSAPVEPPLTINGSRIKFRQIQLRPKGTIELHELFVVRHESEESQLQIAWEATDGSALGRASGTVQLTVVNPPEVEELIGTFLKGGADDDRWGGDDDE